jgi:hypothetical protein
MDKIVSFRSLTGRGTAVTAGPDPQGTRSQRWLARLSFVLARLAIAILVVFVGLKSLAMLGVALASAVVSLGAERTGACPSTPPRPPRSDMRAISRSSELASAQYASMIQHPVDR